MTISTALSIFDDKPFVEQLVNAERPQPLFKSAVERANTAFDKAFLAEVEIEELIRERAVFIDRLLGYVWQRFDWGKNDSISLVAVGGYGRGELHPYSDIDLLILLANDSFEQHRDNVEVLVTFLWDINLDIGHSVRTIEECPLEAQKDITIATNLMESRTIAGPEQLHAAMLPLVGQDKVWPRGEFFDAKWQEQIARHKKFNDTEYNLEPNVKSCPGGLRDIQMIGWVAKRHFEASSIDELHTQGFLTEEEVNIIYRGQGFLWRVRYALHMLAKRAEDRLLFDYQAEIAAIFGYENNEDKLGVEQFMQSYYRWALALTELNDMLMQLFNEDILKACEAEKFQEINQRFRLRNNYIEVCNDNVFKSTPSALLEIFVIMSQQPRGHIKGVRATTIRMIRENRHLIDDDFRADPRNRQLFLDLLSCKTEVALNLKRMKRYGVLGKYIPAFGRIVGQTQHDLFHIYTVDAHTILLIKFLRRFSYPDSGEVFPVATHVLKRIPKIELLYIAGLFHDIAKGRGGDHSELGADEAYHFCRDHGYNRRDGNLVGWLVRKHLLMSRTSQREDILDPEVIRKFAIEMGDQLHLDYLFALTVADINATNTTLWNSWRASLMRQLYLETKRALRRGLEQPIDTQELIEDTQNAAIAKLESKGYSREQVFAIWDNPGDDYFIRETSNDIAWHTEGIANHKDKDTPLILIKEVIEKRFTGVSQIFIHTKERKSLFALIVTSLDQLNLSIQHARVFNSQSNHTLDTFFVLGDNNEIIAEDSERISFIKESLTTSLAAQSDYTEVVQRRTPRKLKYFSEPTKTSIRTDTNKGQSILEVITPDRPGLLAHISQIFVELDIRLQNARIATLGERVEDVFFITDKKGNAFEDPAICEHIQQAVRDTLDEQA